MRILLHTLILSFLLAPLVSSAQVGDTFEYSLDISSFEPLSSTVYIDRINGKFEPPFYVYQANDGLTGLFNKNIDFGDGSHGVFNANTYAQFSEGGDISGNIIRFNLTTYPELKVTEFILEAGWTIEPIGDAPLIIKSTGTVTIAGTINCSGDDGEDGRGGIGDRDVVSEGGQGRCGGGNGGDGGYLSANATNGTEVGVLPIAPGQAGGRNTANANGAGGGGGGGAFAPDVPGASGPSIGKDNDAFALEGQRGTSFEDNVISTTGGGTGGGGGGYADFGGTGGTGGGGGGGGGSVYIFSRGNINISGLIDISGGDGGEEANTSGPGGGGGGGTAWIISREKIVVEPTGSVDGNRGQGGSSAGNDGDGSEGRTFVTDKGNYVARNAFGFEGTPANVYPPAIFAPFGNTLSRLADPNPPNDATEATNVDYFEVVSPVLDTEARSFEVTGFSFTAENSANGSATLQMKGAMSENGLDIQDFETLDPNVTSIFQDARYYQFRILMTNNDGDAGDNGDRENPFRITGLTINFAKSQVNSFDFKSDGGGCGAILPLGSNGPGAGGDVLRELLWWQSFLLLGLLLSPLGVLLFKRKHSSFIEKSLS